MIKNLSERFLLLIYQQGPYVVLSDIPMNLKFILQILLFAIFTGCQAQTNAPEKYAELRISKEDRIQVLIVSKKWEGLLNAHYGFAGYYSHTTFFWTTLDGTKSEYVNPQLNINSSVQYRHRGFIKVDRQGKFVVIALERLISKQDEAERWEPSPANGTYSIKTTNHDSFQIPN